MKFEIAFDCDNYNHYIEDNLGALEFKKVSNVTKNSDTIVYIVDIDDIGSFQLLQEQLNTIIGKTTQLIVDFIEGYIFVRVHNNLLN